MPRLLCWQAKDGARREQYDEVDLANMMTTRNPIFNNVIISRPSSVCGPRQAADISGSGGGGGDGGEEEQVDGRRRRRQETSMAAEERTHNQQHHKKSLIKKRILIDKTALRRNCDPAEVSQLRLPDMCVYFYDSESFRSSIHMRSSAYVWMTVLMGIFYTLPVFQLVLHYQETTFQTGNLDVCYYNFRCMHPLLGLEDFGHIFSNAGYVLSGLFFVFIVWCRSRKYAAICKKACSALDRNDLRHPNNNGIPEQYGIYYAMGTALAFEGVLSGCYHICPTAKNFQFDTTFMYAIAVLLFLKVYQFRHPDITQTAHLVFLAIAVAMVLEVFGYFTHHSFFWVIFILVYLCIISFFVIHVYTNGKSLTKLFKHLSSRVLSLVSCGEVPTCRDLLQPKNVPTLVLLLLNVVMASFFAAKRKPGVSRYLLIITMSNMIFYVVYYIMRKLFHRCRSRKWIATEGIRKTTSLYGLLALGSMAAAVTLFKFELKSSAVAAAMSRDLNKGCAIGVFNNHDLWHFFSTAGLFFTFMFILTLEDKNISVPRHKIYVF